MYLNNINYTLTATHDQNLLVERSLFIRLNPTYTIQRLIRNFWSPNWFLENFVLSLIDINLSRGINSCQKTQIFIKIPTQIIDRIALNIRENFLQLILIRERLFLNLPYFKRFVQTASSKYLRDLSTCPLYSPDWCLVTVWLLYNFHSLSILRILFKNNQGSF